MGPVAVSGAPTAVQSAGAPEASARNTTDQPAGSVGGVTPGAVDAASTAARVKSSAAAPLTAGETVVSLTKGAGHGWPTPGIGPVSGAAAPPLLMSGLAPSCWKKPTVVPAGKPFDVTVMSKVSVPLPRFHT